MRIGVAGLLHESNTFAGTRTVRQHFEEAFLHRGADLIPVWREAHHELGGFIEGCANVEIVPLLAGWATPGGPVTDETYDSLTAELVAQLEAAEPLDGLLLALHGAMVTASHANADGETLARVREAVGPDLPIVVTLDMHGNVSQRMADLASAIVAYRTYPHVDQRQRGLEAAALLERMVRGEVEAHMAFRKLPLLIHIVQQFTSDGPMAEIFREVDRLSGEPHVLSVSVLPGYIYADVPDMGVSVVVVADNRETAERTADELAAFVFGMREALNADLPDTATAVAEAIHTPGTVCLMDGGDNIGGGGPGDSTILLEEILRQGGERACVVLLDSEAVKTCEDAGVGGTVSLDVGAKTDDQHGRPVALQGTVRALSDGRFVESEARHGGMRDCDQGPTAVVDTDDGHTIVLNSLRIMPTSLNQLTSLGLIPTDFELIVVKGVTAPREAYDPIAAKVIAVDTPGVTRAGPETFVYKNRPKPLYPLEPDTRWPSTS